jgi:hypothetical protein
MNTMTNSSEPMTEDQLTARYLVYIDYIRHENELLNHRTTWFLAIETVIIAGAGYLLLSYFESIASHLYRQPDSPFPHVLEFMLAWGTLCCFGMIAARSAARSIKAALDAQDTLTDHWNALTSGEALVSKLPDLMGGKSQSAREDGGYFADRLVWAVSWFWGISIVCLVGLALTFLIR